MANVTPLAAGESLAAGAEGEQVEELQRRLAYLGYYEGAVDGRYDDATERAVGEYRTATGQADGAVDHELWERLGTDAQGAGYHDADSDGGYSDTAGFGSEANGGADGSATWDGSGGTGAAGDGTAGNGTAGGDAGATGSEAGDSGGLAVGQVSEDGQWQWNGTDWVAATRAGQLSEDGQWRWNGSEWVAAEATQDAAPTAEPAAEILSEDGQYRWDGEKWLPVNGQPTEPAAGEAKPWTREINSEVDDGTTEAAEPPAVGSEGDGRG